MEKLTIGKLAKNAGVGVETVRFYQKKGLIREPKAVGAYRTYSDEDAMKIIFIKKAQELGFTLNEVKELLEINKLPRTTCSAVKKKADEKIREIEEKINDLTKMKESLSSLINCCDESLELTKDFKVQDCFNYKEKCQC